MSKLTQSFGALSHVLLQPFYFFLMLIVAFLFFALNIYAANFSLLVESLFEGKFVLVPALFMGGINSIASSSLVVFVVLSVLLGILASLFVFKARAAAAFQTKKSTLAGVILSVIVPTCASCGVGVAYILGFGAFFAYLPFRGLELGILAVLILVYAVYSTSLQLFSCVSH